VGGGPNAQVGSQAPSSRFRLWAQAPLTQTALAVRDPGWPGLGLGLRGNPTGIGRVRIGSFLHAVRVHIATEPNATAQQADAWRVGGVRNLAGQRSRHRPPCPIRYGAAWPGGPPHGGTPSVRRHRRDHGRPFCGLSLVPVRPRDLAAPADEPWDATAVGPIPSWAGPWVESSPGRRPTGSSAAFPTTGGRPAFPFHVKPANLGPVHHRPPVGRGQRFSHMGLMRFGGARTAASPSARRGRPWVAGPRTPSAGTKSRVAAVGPQPRGRGGPLVGPAVVGTLGHARPDVPGLRMLALGRAQDPPLPRPNLPLR
jgi:hypothetical protein